MRGYTQNGMEIREDGVWSLMKLGTGQQPEGLAFFGAMENVCQLTFMAAGCLLTMIKLVRGSRFLRQSKVTGYSPFSVTDSSRSSILLKKIISDHNEDNRIGIACFYFNFQSETAKDLASVLSSLIKQLCRRKSEIPQSLVDLYNRCTFNDKAPKVRELQAQFRTIIDTFEEVFLVIDAMDECNECHRKQFLQFIVELFHTSSSRLKIFVASRPEKDIERTFVSKAFETILIEAKRVDKDISVYVQHELAHRQHDYCDIDEDFRKHIEDALVSQSGGM